MSDAWYDEVGSEAPLTQGDLVSACPVAIWTTPESFQIVAGMLVSETGVQAEDVIVMTQACDLEHGKGQNVIVCPTNRLSAYRSGWEAEQLAHGRKSNNDTWKKFCKTVKSGFVWNLSMLNRCTDPQAEHRIVDFRQVYSTPRMVIEKALAHRGGTRLRLRPPYREHLSQAFARFFMRVGLPIDIDDAW